LTSCVMILSGSNGPLRKGLPRWRRVYRNPIVAAGELTTPN
jgi:hypothetical protein